jgi:hypothetical protein
MAITYTTTVSSMTVAPFQGSLTDVVTSVTWVVTGTDGKYTARKVGTTAVGGPDPTKFTAYPDLTPTQVLGWIPNPSTPKVQATIAAQIAQMEGASASVIKMPPWQKFRGKS